MTGSRGWRVLWAAVTCSVVLPIAAAASPITGITLTGWDDTSLTVIVDGTSNTIFFGDTTRISGCVQRVSPVTSIVDGSSNTIVLGETVDVCWNDEEELPLARGGSSSITDGTSNTILIGETPYLFDPGNSTIDVCLSNPSIADGASNTIILPEIGQPLCLSGTVSPSPIPEPASLFLLGSGLAVLAQRSRSRLRARPSRPAHVPE